MRITPLDIRKQEFRKTMRGLDNDEVYAFLNTVAEEYEVVLSDNKRLRERIVELEGQLKDYKEIESNLRNTLLTAEKMTAEARENARREASLIVRESEMEAQKAAEVIRAHTVQLRREILDLKKQKDNYLTRLKTLIESHRKVLEGFEEDFAHVDREIEEIGKKVEEDATKQSQTPRMSREKITEEFAHGPTDPTDKVTWGDERRREDEPRPQMPGPGRKASGAPEEKASRPEDTIEPAPKSESTGQMGTDESPAAPSEGQGDTQISMPHLDTQPIGAVDDFMHTPDAARESTTVQQMEQGPGIPRGEAGNWTGDQVHDNVAHNVEVNMYPEPETSPGNMLADQGTVEPQGRITTTAQSGPQPYPTPEMQEQQVDTVPEAEMPKDSWKDYNVHEEKPDWNEYEVPREVKREAPIGSDPSDKEVEIALSNLTEIPGTDRGQSQTAAQVAPQAAPTPEQATGPQVPQNKQVPPQVEVQMPPQAVQAPPQAEAQAKPQAEAQAKPQAEAQAKPQAEAQAKPQAEAQARPQAEGQARPQAEGQAPREPASQGQPQPEQENGADWSLEELRKNLTNFSRNEE
ncbi:MAG: DivIVA domain-containing protein [bacterium]|nr:MAG: DivIVA domain-containing protein [bacterium]